MSIKYKFHDPTEIYFVSFAVVDWIDVFTRAVYRDILLESLSYCRKEKGLKLHAWVIMSNHIHLIISSKEGYLLPNIMRDLKKYSSFRILKEIKESITESRKEWMLWMFERAGSKSSNVKGKQFWQYNNKPIELWSAEVIEQKADYLHDNPIVSGYVNEAWHWKYSSAIDYSGGKG